MIGKSSVQIALLYAPLKIGKVDTEDKAFTKGDNSKGLMEAWAQFMLDDNDNVVGVVEPEPFGYVLKPVETRELHSIVEMALYKSGAERERKQLTKDLEAALREVRTLRWCLPTCSFCKKIRDDSGDWQQIEIYPLTIGSGVQQYCLSGLRSKRVPVF